MTKNILIANWKMNLGLAESEKLAVEILDNAPVWPDEQLEVVLCPTVYALTTVAKNLSGKKISLGAQNCFWEDAGAYTGEVSPKVLKELGCRYVILGHSERRQFLGETDQQVNLKVKAALRNDLVPVVCVGETFAERQEGQKDFVIMRQVNRALEGVKLLKNDQLIIAYEPVWVIGSGQAVAPEEAEHTSRVIQQVLLDSFSAEVLKGKTRIIYGGSVKPENVKSFLNTSSIEGILVGGASLQADNFIELIKQSAL